MSHVKLLEDVQFLIQYATQIFPPNVERVLELDAGALILENIEKLQAELTRMRENSINALYSAITQLYPEQEPEKLFNTAVEVSKLFQKERFATKKEILKMTQLTSDCSKVFPTDFAAIDYNEILQLVSYFFVCIFQFILIFFFISYRQKKRFLANYNSIFQLNYVYFFVIYLVYLLNLSY